jgi:hypothetical protein
MEKCKDFVEGRNEAGMRVVIGRIAPYAETYGFEVGH